MKSKIKVVVAALAGVFAGSVAFGANITNVQTNEGDFVWIGEASSGYSGADVAAGKITGYNFFKGSNADGSGVSYITNDLTLAGGSGTEGGFVRLMGRNLASWKVENYNTALANGEVPIVYVGPAEGSGDEVITIDIEGKSGLLCGYRNDKTYGDPDGNGRNTYVTITNGAFGGYAKFIVNGYPAYGNVSCQAGFWAEHFIISENATPKQGESTIDFLELGVFSGATAEQGAALLQEFHNKSAYDARILFNGGRLYEWYIGCGNEYTPIYADAGKKLIFESVNDKPIDIYKAAKAANLFDGDGVWKLVGSADLRIGSDNHLVRYAADDDKGHKAGDVKNNLPWTIQGGKNPDWSDFSGNIVLHGKCGLRLRGNDQLPWGADKGNVQITQDSYSASLEQCWNISALLLDAGRQVHLNGIVNAGAQGSKCYVSNTTASASSAYSTFILGDGGVDGQLSIRVTAKCAIEKVGSGTLTIVDTTFEEGSKLTLKEGTTIIDETIYNEIKDREGMLTVEDGATVVCEKVINVASGEMTDTTKYTDCADGTVLRIRKTGAGTLILDNAGNSFTGGIVVEGGKVEIAQDDVVWTGAGADTSATTTENWKNSVLPNFTSPLTRDRPVFGEGGDEAVFPAGTSRLNGLLFNREGDFTVGGADATTLLKIAAPIEVAATASPHVYTITAPIGIENGDHAMTVGEDQTLRIKNVVKPSGVNAKVSLCGPGEVLLEDAAFAGVVDAKNNVKLRLKGNVGAADDTDRIEIVRFKSGDSVDTQLRLDGATIDKPIHATIGASDWLDVTAGSSNVFKKPFSVGHADANPTTQFLLDEGNVSLVFEGGLCEGSCVGMTGVRSSIDFGVVSKVPNVKFIFNGPLRLPDKTYGTAGASYTYQGPIIIFNCTGNTCGKCYSLQYADTFFNVDNAFTDTPYFSIGSGSSTADFTTTRQEIPNFVIADTKGYLKGSYPATLAITEGWADRATAISKKFGPSGINGWLKLEKSGPGYHVVGLSTGNAKAYASCGDIEVSGGTLEFLPNTTWQKGTNIIVRGTGRLVLNAADHFGAQAIIRLADEGKIVLPANTTLSVKNIYVNGQPFQKGTYSYSATDFPWLEGEGVTITATADPEPLVNVWTGAGADTLTTTAENWENGILDSRAIQTAEFGAGGSEAVFPAGETAFESIVFSREGGFTLKGADATATVKLAKREAIAFAGGGTDEPVVYTVEPKLQFGSDETMIDVKEPNQTLVLKGEIVGAEDILKKGVGTLELDGATLSGDFRHETAGTLVLKGEIGSGDDGTIFVNPKNMYTTFAGATIDRQVEFVDGNGAAASNVVFKQGTTTVFKKPVAVRKQGQNAVYLFGEKDARIVFEDEFKLAGTLGQSVSFCASKVNENYEVTFDGGINFPGCNVNLGVYNFHGVVAHLTNPKNVLGKLAFNYGKTICYHDNQFTNSNGYATLSCTGGNSTVSLLDLNGTHQKFDNVDLTVKKGTVMTDAGKPATLEIATGRADRDECISSMFCPDNMTGPVTIKMSGSGYLLVSTNNLACACATTGDLVVENGTVEVENKVTFPNVPNVRVTGGQLKLDANPFSAAVIVNFGETAGTLDLTADVNCRTAYIGGQRVEAGEYSAGDGTAVGARLSGAGKLIVHSSGMILMLK